MRQASKRPSRLKKRGLYVGVDVGGTKVLAGVVTSSGEVVATARRSTPGRLVDPTIVEDALVAAVLDVADGTPIAAVGVAAAGFVDQAGERVMFAPHLPWRGEPVRAHLQQRWGAPVVLDNDANCAVLGEAWVGAAREARYVLGVTIGTGIGGGIVLDRRLHHGASDCAGEIGHITIDMDGRRCGCGNYGCLEAYASGPAIAMRAREQIRSGAESRLADLVGGDLEAVTAQTVYEAASIGDDLARDVVRATAQYLGTGIANLLNVFNPDLVVVMGGVTQAGDGLFEPLRRVVAQRAFKPAVDACRIVPGTLSGLAGVYGAARMFLDQRDAA